MLSRLRKNFGAAGLIVAVVALVAALGGGAYAASSGDNATASQKKGKQKKGQRVVITNVNQIRPNVRRALKGNRGPQGPQGAPGAPGAQGLPGANGLDGQNGSNGSNGQDGATGPTGPTGAPGSPWTLGGVLPEGATETGTFAGSGTIDAFAKVVSPISFTVPLSEADAELISEEDGGAFPNINVLAIGEGETADCPGTADAPDAEPGQLCIYTTAKSGLFGGEVIGVSPPSQAFETGEGGVATSGAIVFGVKSAAAGFAQIGGSWAVTAQE